MEQRVLIDYFVCSFKIYEGDDPMCIFRLLRPPDYDYDQDKDVPVPGYDEFKLIKSYYGLEKCWIYEGVKIHVGDDLMILDCSGKGCRTLETDYGIKWESFFGSLKRELTHRRDSHSLPRAHISRLDVSCDVLDSDKFTVSKIWNYVDHGKYVCKSHRKVHGDGDEEWVYFGSSQSDRRLRIYNKALEQGTPDKKWVRAEFQLRNEDALSFVLNYYEQKSVPETYYGIMHDYLRITKKSLTDLTMTA